MPPKTGDKFVGFYDEVAEFLQSELADNPDSQDLRLKLLEVYCSAGRLEEFLRQAKEFHARMTPDDKSQWRQVVAMGRRLLANTDQYANLREEQSRPTDSRWDVFEQRIAQPEGEHKRLTDLIGDPELDEALASLRADYDQLHRDPAFLPEVDEMLSNYIGLKPSPLYHARRLSEHCGGGRIHLKRTDLRTRGTHKLLNAMGQAMVAQRLGKTHLVAGTVKGHHGVAVAAIAAHLGLGATVIIDEESLASAQRQAAQIELFGAHLEVLKRPGGHGQRDLATVLNRVRAAAMKQWMSHRDDTLFVNGLAAGPDPYPAMLRDFQGIIGRETRHALLNRHGTHPATLVACIDGDVDVIGFFAPFIAREDTRLVGVESQAVMDSRRRRADNPFQGKRYALFSEQQIAAAHSILDDQGYPSTRREHQWLTDTGRIRQVQIDNKRARQAQSDLATLEGIAADAESAYALAYALELAPELDNQDDIAVLINAYEEEDSDGLNQATVV